MSLNGINSQMSSYIASSTTSTQSQKTTAKSSSSLDTASAVYEKSSASNTTSTKTNTASVSKMKAELQEHANSLQSLVQKMFNKQGKAWDASTDMFEALRSGSLNIDADTAAKAKEDISENGYWGSNQTSDRIVSFAKALTGGDSEKADKMIAAFQKGYELAAKAWGGELPDLCKQTYDSTMEKLNNWKNSTESDK